MDQSRAIRARGVTKRYGDVIALDGVDLDVAGGQVHGLVGPNGAGKTTLLGLVLGLSSPDAGHLEVRDEVAGFVDGPGLYPTLTARKNLTALAALRGYDAGRSGVDAALDRVGLADVADDRVAGFSLGMRQRLGLASALLGDPRLLVLDEPANGLDAAGRRQVHGVISELAAAGAAVVLSSHRMDDLAGLCDEVTILRTGRVVFTGPLAKLATEIGELDHAVGVSDRAAAEQVARGIVGVRLRQERDAGTLVVHASPGAIDDLVTALVRAGVGVRELAPLVPALETAFLRLTGGEEDQR